MAAIANPGEPTVVPNTFRPCAWLPSPKGPARPASRRLGLLARGWSYSHEGNEHLRPLWL